MSVSAGTVPDTPEGLLFVVLEAVGSSDAVRAASLLLRNYPDGEPFTVEQMVGVWKMRWPRHERLQPQYRAVSRCPRGLVFLMRCGTVDVGQDDTFAAAGAAELRSFIAARVPEADQLDKTVPENESLPVSAELQQEAWELVQAILTPPAGEPPADAGAVNGPGQQ